MPTYNKLGILRVVDGSNITDNYAPTAYDADYDSEIHPYYYVSILRPFKEITDIHDLGGGTVVIEIDTNMDYSWIEYRFGTGSWLPLPSSYEISQSFTTAGEKKLEVRRANGTGDFQYRASDSYTFWIYDLSEYGKRWECKFTDNQGGAWAVTIYKQKYTGDVEEICMAGDPVIIEVGTGDDAAIFNTINATRCRLNLMVVTGAEGFNEVVSASDFEFKVEVSGNYQFFSGYLSGEGYQESYIAKPYVLSLVATDMLSYLKGIRNRNAQGQAWNHPRLRLDHLFRHCLRECRQTLRYRFWGEWYPNDGGNISNRPPHAFMWVDCSTFNEDDTLFDILVNVFSPLNYRIYMSSGLVREDDDYTEDLGWVCSRLNFGQGSIQIYSKRFSDWEEWTGGVGDARTGRGLVCADFQGAGLEFLTYADRDHVLRYRNTIRELFVKWSWKNNFQLCDPIQSHNDADDLANKNWGFGVGTFADTDWLSFRNNNVLVVHPANPSFNQEFENSAQGSALEYSSENLRYIFSRPQRLYRVSGYNVRFKLSVSAAFLMNANVTSLLGFSIIAGGYHWKYTLAPGGIGWVAIDIDGSGTDTSESDLIVQRFGTNFPEAGYGEQDRVFVTDFLPAPITGMTEENVQVRLYFNGFGDNGDAVEEVIWSNCKLEAIYTKIADNTNLPPDGEEELISYIATIGPKVDREIKYGSLAEFGTGLVNKYCYKDRNDNRITTWQSLADPFIENSHKIMTLDYVSQFGIRQKVFEGTFLGVMGYDQTFGIPEGEMIVLSLSISLKQRKTRVLGCGS